MDARGIPILTGMSAMEKMKMIIDFSTGAAVIGSVDPNSVVQLPKSSNGHLMIDLLKPWNQQGKFVCHSDQHPPLHAVSKASKLLRDSQAFSSQSSYESAAGAEVSE